jgi:hypothetical protein
MWQAYQVRLLLDYLLHEPLLRETFVDAQVERYWQLLAINGRLPQPAAVPSFEWLIAALRADNRARPTQGNTAPPE